MEMQMRKLYFFKQYSNNCKYVLDIFGLKVYDRIGVGIEWNYIYVFVV